MRMAKQQRTPWKVIIFHLFLCCVLGMNFFIVSVLGSSIKYCYYGKDINSLGALLNETCDTGETHLAQTLLVTDNGHDGVSNSPKMSINSSKSSPNNGGNCFIFRKVSSSDLPSGIKKESVHTKFGCDYDMLCEGKEVDTVLYNVNFRGTVGQLYCCSTDNCNSVEKMPHTPAENRICYKGSSNGSSSRVSLESCNHPDVYCMKLTHFSKDGRLEAYSCDKHDNQGHCDPSGMNGAYRFCDNRTVNGVFRELCCCDSNKCNQPSDLKLLDPENDLAEQTIIDGRKRKPTHPIMNPHAKDESNKVITGLVAAVVLLVFAGITIILYLAYKKRKQRGTVRRDPNVIMQYERLSSSEQDLEEPVVV